MFFVIAKNMCRRLCYFLNENIYSAAKRFDKSNKGAHMFRCRRIHTIDHRGVDDKSYTLCALSLLSVSVSHCVCSDFVTFIDSNLVFRFSIWLRKSFMKLVALWSTAFGAFLAHWRRSTQIKVSVVHFRRLMNHQR